MGALSCHFNIFDRSFVGDEMANKICGRKNTLVLKEIIYLFLSSFDYIYIEVSPG